MGCMTSDSGPDLEPILTADGSRRREIFEVRHIKMNLLGNHDMQIQTDHFLG